MSMYEEIMATDEGRKEVSAELALLSATELIVELMQKNKLKRKDLADRMGVSKSRVTQILDGETDMRLSTLAYALSAMGEVLEFNSRAIAANTKQCIWFDPGTGGEWMQNQTSDWSGSSTIDINSGIQSLAG